ncbi:hypothetical protein [Halobacteriovorax sp.]|uniref:hypothetical protein n=1 Tax=Halobacteriovorax sp. TaxID=2020862 RepID=UPI003AF20F38
MKRVNISIDESLHKKVHEDNLNLSALVREKLEDFYSESKITVSVTQEIHELYNKAMALTGGSDEELSPYISEAIIKYLANKKEDLNKEIDELLKKHL